MKKLQLVAIGLMTVYLSGCSTWGKMNQTEKGAAIGAGSGALIGTAVSGDAKGALIGGAVGGVGGGVIGHQMEDDE